jgi:cell division protein FtsQ
VSRPTMTRSGLPAAPRPVVSAPPDPEPSGRARFALRARQVRRAGLWWKAGLPVALALPATLVWLVVWGPLLVVRSVTVPGVSASMAAQVRAAVAVPSGSHLLGLDLSAARTRVARLRAVGSVQVSRSWPGTVVVDVSLRRPVAVVKDAHGVLHLADRTGATYAEVTAVPRGLPLVGADAADPAAVQAVVQVLSDLPPGLRVQVRSATAKDPLDVVLSLGRLTVTWGSAADSQRKAAVLQVLRREQPTARRIDVSAPQAPSVG